MKRRCRIAAFCLLFPVLCLQLQGADEQALPVSEKERLMEDHRQWQALSDNEKAELCEHYHQWRQLTMARRNG
jgi:hypothetical protein